MFKIGFARGTQRNIALELKEFETFEELSAVFKECMQGGKHESYFIRGGDVELTDHTSSSGHEWGKIYPRIDKALKSAQLLIIDADKAHDGSNAPPLKEISAALVMLGVNHFGYTTHSQTKDINKCRVAIPCELPSKAHLAPTMEKLILDLHEQGCLVELNTEMKRWTSAWFLPTRDDPKDGQFKHVEYFHGDIYYAADPVEYQAKKKENKKAGKSDAIRIEEIQSGKAIHENLLSLSWGYGKDGVTKTGITTILRTIMNGCKVKDERWQTRYDDIERITEEGIGKIDKLNVEAVEDIVKVTKEVSFAPGLFGQLMQDSYNMQMYQYKEVALVSAVGLIAGVCGRAFNAVAPKPLGLNVYLTLIMNTGMGKDSIRNFVNHCLRPTGLLNIQSTFVGAQRFTSATAINRHLKEGRSRVCVFTEAGLLLGASGDSASLARILLGIYSQSAFGDISGAEEYSDIERKIESLSSPALTIVNEATPETLLKGFRESGSLEMGYIPRQSIFRVNGEKPYANPLPEEHISAKCAERIKNLIAFCSQYQLKDDKIPVFVLPENDDIRDRITNHSRKCNDIYNRFINIDTRRALMASRGHVKALKYAALCAAFNQSKDPVITSEIWDWAENLEEFEMDGVEVFFQGSGIGGGDNMEEIAVSGMCNCIIKALKRDSPSDRSNCTPDEVRNGHVRYSVLKQRTKGSKRLRMLDDPESRSNPISGFEKIIKHLINNGYIYDVKLNDEFDTRRGKSIGITEEFSALVAVSRDELTTVNKMPVRPK